MSLRKDSVLVRYRPKIWDEVIGQANAVALLRKMVETGEIYNNHYLIA